MDARVPLDEATLRADVLTGVWTGLRVLARTGSTNADAAEAARAGAPEGLIILAEDQTAGRGRLDRVWQTPPHAAITMSVLLRPPVAPARLGWVPLLAGLALAETVRSVAGAQAALKWPNDLLVGEPLGKCAGILAEMVDGAVVVGLGLNVDQRAEELPPVAGSPFPPTSLRLAGSAVDRDSLVRALLGSLSGWYLAWTAADGDPDASGLRAAYTSACLTVGHDVTVSLPGGASVQGLATGVDTGGRLIVGGRPLAAGDVRHVR